MTRPRSIGEAIRREVQPAWDEVNEARVLRRVMSQRPRRATWAIVTIAIAAVIVAAIAMWQVNVATHEDVTRGSLAPMERMEPSRRETSVRMEAPSKPRRIEATPPQVEPSPPFVDPAPAVITRRPDAASLLEQADAARRRGELVEATSLLRRFIDAHPRHPEAASVRMSLARVLEQRRRFVEAARAYEALLGASVIGPIREDARAGAARVWARAGRDERARAHAQAYLERNPSGPHVRAMEAITSR
jgi:hypothetical protein